MSDVIRRCRLCNEELTNSRSDYCDAKCRKSYSHWHHLPEEEFNKKVEIFKKLDEPLICKNCDKEFIPKQINQLDFCSRKCSQQHNSRRRYNFNPENFAKLGQEFECKVCNKTFICQSTNQLYCSKTCCYRYNQWKDLDPEELQIKIDRAKHFGEKIKCKHCNKSFVPDRINNYKYCSRQCCDDYGANVIANKKKTCRNYLKEEKTKAGKCENCEETNVLLLEFAHYNRNKTMDIHECINLELLKEEMSRGRWLCIYCHRIETYTEVARVKIEDKPTGYKYIYDTKLEIGKCQLCDFEVNENNHYCFDFDHLDQSTKSRSLCQLAGSTIEIIQKEIDKCRLLCCKCHRLHSINQEKENRLNKAK